MGLIRVRVLESWFINQFSNQLIIDSADFRILTLTLDKVLESGWWWTVIRPVNSLATFVLF